MYSFFLYSKPIKLKYYLFEGNLKPEAADVDDRQLVEQATSAISYPPLCLSVNIQQLKWLSENFLGYSSVKAKYLTPEWNLTHFCST